MCSVSERLATLQDKDIVLMPAEELTAWPILNKAQLYLSDLPVIKLEARREGWPSGGFCDWIFSERGWSLWRGELGNGEEDSMVL